VKISLENGPIKIGDYLTAYEKNLILSQFGDANSMNLTTEEKATILEALNRQQ
jgi:hypothetical protein